MIAIALGMSISMLGVGVLFALWRLLKGPTPLDRLLAFDVINGMVVALIALLSIVWQETYYLEALVLFSVFGFLSIATIVFYLDMAVADRGQTSFPAATPEQVIDGADSGDERYDL
ncbi:MAG: K+/H+ antiporter subunit F [Silvanigrellales bacterium]|nr:K+/H+ antiporter subunit F [Silvanigrellales bacterium]